MSNECSYREAKLCNLKPETFRLSFYGDGQGSLAHCSPWGRKESDMTEGLN